MFTGLVEACAEVATFNPVAGGARLEISAPPTFDDTRLGDSIAVNGCCLTAVVLDGGKIAFDLLAETLDKTNLGTLAPGAKVNLERSLRADARLGGHFVQGHVDTTAAITALEPRGADHRLEIALPPEFARYVVYKGGIAVDGISLTVAEAHADRFVCWIIPHTMSATVLHTRRAGDRVNLEFDLLAKYVERLLGANFKQNAE